MFGIKNTPDDVLDVAKIGETVLKQKAAAVTDPTSDETKELIEKMFTTMRVENGMGLAAPQVFVSKQIITLLFDGKKYVLINPHIVARSKEMVIFKEGCLSIPGKEYDIVRHQKVTVQYTDERGVKTKIKASDLFAVLCQHEIDHLNGILMSDRFEKQQKTYQKLDIPLKVYQE